MATYARSLALITKTTTRLRVRPSNGQHHHHLFQSQFQLQTHAGSFQTKLPNARLYSTSPNYNHTNTNIDNSNRTSNDPKHQDGLNETSDERTRDQGHQQQQQNQRQERSAHAQWYADIVPAMIPVALLGSAVYLVSHSLIYLSPPWFSIPFLLINTMPHHA